MEVMGLSGPSWDEALADRERQAVESLNLLAELGVVAAKLGVNWQPSAALVEASKGVLALHEAQQQGASAETVNALQAATASRQRSRGGSRGAVSELVLEVLRDVYPNQTIRPDELVTPLQQRGWTPGKRPGNQLNTLLDRLSKSDAPVEKVASGRYQLVADDPRASHDENDSPDDGLPGLDNGLDQVEKPMPLKDTDSLRGQSIVEGGGGFDPTEGQAPNHTR